MDSFQWNFRYLGDFPMLIIYLATQTKGNSQPRCLTTVTCLENVSQKRSTKVIILKFCFLQPTRNTSCWLQETKFQNDDIFFASFPTPAFKVTAVKYHGWELPFVRVAKYISQSASNEHWKVAQVAQVWLTVFRCYVCVRNLFG